MVTVDAVARHLDERLNVEAFTAEVHGNGLLFRAGEGMTRLASACTSTLRAIEAACEAMGLEWVAIDDPVD